MTLGDLGADVIKVERPGSGDESRGWGPPFDSDGESAYYLCCNRNKLSIGLDLDSVDDLGTLRDLIAEADVVLENFRDGVLSSRGVVATELLAQHSQLIWCTISGFGPGSARPGYDYVVQAECGWMAVTGEPEGAPMKSGIALADVLAGKDAAIAILGALLARDRAAAPLSPPERQLHVSLQHSATAALINVAQNTLVTGVEARRWGNAHPNLVPYQLFPAEDRPVVVAVGNDSQWRSLCRALDLHDLVSDASLERNSGRLAQRARVVDAIASRLRTAPAGHWLGILDRAGVPCGVVKGVTEALAAVDASPVTGITPPVPGSVRRRPPRLDEHGALIRRHGWRAFSVSA